MNQAELNLAFEKLRSLHIRLSGIYEDSHLAIELGEDLDGIVELDIEETGALLDLANEITDLMVAAGAELPKR